MRPHGWGAGNRYNDPRYRRLRVEALDRDGWRCRQLVDNVRCLQPAHTADHIISRADDGPDELWNLQALCTHHHKLKTQQESRVARGRFREQRTPAKHPGLL